MDFNAAMETFAEAWVVANTPKSSSKVENKKYKGDVEAPTMMVRGQLTASSQEVVSSSPKKYDVTSSQSSNAKSLPIHCIVEQVHSSPSSDPPTSTSVELDSYAILPNSTLLLDLVKTALLKLGYSSSDALNSKGAIQIKKWKPLSFDVISDDPKATIEEILGELTNVVTLRIRLASPPRQSSTDDVKEKLLQLLLTQSQSLLNDSGCPIEKNILASLSKGENLSECLADGLSDEMRGAFDKWYSDQLQRSSKPSPSPTTTSASPPALQVKKEKEEEPVDAAYRSFLSHKTRIRTSFDPEYEISRLQKWFQENQHPSRDQMLAYMNELNSLDRRKRGRKLDLTNIIYWFKNARAAQRRATKALDDSFDNEDNPDSNHGDANIPYLPNKNAVYVIPFPYHRPLTSADEPCDLSINKRPASKDLEEETTMRRESSEDCPDDREMDESGGLDNEDRMSANTQEACHESVYNGRGREKSVSMATTNNNNNNGGSSDPDNRDNREPHNGTLVERGEREEIEGGTDNDSEDSDSSCDSEREGERKGKEEEKGGGDYSLAYGGVSAANMSPASMAAMSLAQMSQPLHIPQIPPHLAMAYYPMNARYYMQHANTLQHSPQHTATSHREAAPHHKTGDSRKRRTRVFIDPLTEIPQLEKWFEEDTHPSAYMIDKYCDELNKTDYRQKFPRLEAKNIQLWFKNHRAKVKRMRLS